MAKLSWGKPTVEYAVSTNGEPGSNADWKEMPEIVEDSATYETTEGELKEATEEGGAVVDARRKRNKYTFTLDIFVKKGDVRPIEDEDGIIVDNYAVRLTPEDEECEGFLFDNSNVTVTERWTSAEGKIIRYIFTAIKPKSGKFSKPYVKAQA